jgi:hypothetical protein
MFVALAIESALPRLSACFHARNWISTARAGTVDRGELAHVRLLSAQIGQYEVPPVAEETFRAGILTALPGFLAPFSPAGRSDFRGRAYSNETTLLALSSDDGIEVAGGGVNVG